MTTGVLTAAQLHDFVRAREGGDFVTLYRDRTFGAEVQGDRLWIRTVSGEHREVRSMAKILELFASSGSFRPGAYRVTGTFNASYVLALIAAFQGRTTGEEFVSSPRAAVTLELPESLKDRIRHSVRAAASSLGCSVSDTRLRHGLELHKNSAIKAPWVGSVYWGRNAPGNVVEVAFDLQRLANRPGKAESERLGRWVRYTVAALDNEPANNHSGDHESWFRAGFGLDEAVEFFDRLAQQSMPLLHDHQRWIVPADDDFDEAHEDDGVHLDATDAVVQHRMQPPEQASIEHMVRMARAACSVSGQQTETVNKTKHFRFLDDKALAGHIAELLELQERKCAITGMHLHFDGRDGIDVDRLSSLDRIDSHGHYEPGNLQLVCRFVNRWRSDGDNANFLRLIQLVKNDPGARSG